MTASKISWMLSLINIRKMKYQSVVLNPDYHFKNDIDRVVLYSGKQVKDYSSPDWISYLHPMQAQILSVFCEERSLVDQYKKLSFDLNLSIESIAKMIEPYIENETPIYTMFSGQKIPLPTNVLIESKKKDKNFKYEDYQTKDFYCDNINITPDRLHKAPQSMLFMLTNKCITNCKYCYADRKTKHKSLSTSKIIEIIEEAKELRMTYIDVIGGEIFCRKDWNIIIKKMVDNNLSPNYISTKVPITEYDIKQLLATGYKNVVQISLDALDDYVLNSIIGTHDGYVEKIKNSIRLLCEYGFTVQIDTILTKLNIKENYLLELFEYIKTIPNLAYWEIRVPEYSIYTPESFTEIQASKKEIDFIGHFIEDEIKYKADFQIYFSDEASHYTYRKGKTTDECFHGGACGILQDRLFILPDGKVSVCEQLYWHPQFIIGDLKEQTISEIWNSTKALKLFEMKANMFRNESRCHTCEALSSCNKRHKRCFVKAIKAYGLDNWDYPDPRCIYAPEIHSKLVYE